MRHRAWLVQQGLLKPKARGRLSQAAKAALAQAIKDGMQFSDYAIESASEAPVVKARPEAAAIVEQPKTREETIIYGIDKGNHPAHSSAIIAVTVCAGCNKTISRCTHKIPQLPSWLDSPTFMSKSKAIQEAK